MYPADGWKTQLSPATTQRPSTGGDSTGGGEAAGRTENRIVISLLVATPAAAGAGVIERTVNGMIGGRVGGRVVLVLGGAATAVVGDEDGGLLVPVELWEEEAT
jgi:hypothetical protein